MSDITKGAILKSDTVPFLLIIHIGPDPEVYIYRNLKYLKNKYPGKLFVSSNNKKLFEFCQKHEIQYFSYFSKPEVVNLISNSTFDLNFRNGFWGLTIERFFALREAHVFFPNSPILHIESDVLLLNHFPFEILAQNKIMWCEVGATHDSAAILYTPNVENTNWLLDEIVYNLKSKNLITDMTMLNKIRLNDKDRVSLFPSITNPAFLDGEYVATDPSALGMWLLGSDPRNLFGFTKRFEWWVEAYNLSYPIKLNFTKGSLHLIQKSQRIRIINLHNHAKNSWFFGSLVHLALTLFVWSSNYRVFARYPSVRYLFRFLSNQNIFKFRFRHFGIVIKMIKSFF